ncbi:replication protein RepA [Shewanella colwelliana]|uniref:replication protein RepA n=1 Tax=Shewanella colwelliana TaxID=23 RepID=UPI0022AEBD18|nr:replication protein RepA [Shewanella colwelliana]MCZ4337096.1 replication protein RepA [Shewanella colwelliana]
MSLTDLKRRKPKPRKKLSVEEFIEDANNYAFGQPSLAKKTRKKKPTHESMELKKQSTKIYRHATFTLTEQSIEQLNELAKTANVAKSRLIRMMITDFATKDKNELASIIENSLD